MKLRNILAVFTLVMLFAGCSDSILSPVEDIGDIGDRPQAESGSDKND